ncbi:Ig-like domain-containing protein [Acetobacterium sp. UBA5834]|uniref:Ig-like domain-containing protein n=1 Tax=Acetobacterium sp. UBA5834 TaxID=1945907 RepID=UPI00257A2534|nr:Ig-like domain-containing protein [Acetobacterium sp. UBA5834]
MKSYTVAGTYTETTTYQNGEIKVSGVNIENATFTGNLTVVDSVVDGDIRLTNSAVQGELLIKGGGTVYLDGGSYQNIILEKPGVKIVLLGQATVENLTARAAANIVVDNQSKVKTLNVDKAASRTSITTQENGTIENIQSRGISDIVLNTPAKLIGFGTNASGSTLVSNAVIEKIVAESKVSLTLNANVGTVLLTATGEGTNIILGNNAVITSLATETRVEITGEGSITSATTNDILNITGTITPDVVYITTKPVVTDANGGLTVSTNTNRTADTNSGSGSSSTWYSDSSNSGTIINSKYDAPPLNPVDPVEPPSPPTPPSPPINIPVEAIQVTPVEADVIMGNTLKLNTVIFPANATNQTIIWESSNNNVATVTNGVVTPVANGEATITARTQDGNKTDTCKITVKTNIAAVTMINTINANNNGIAETIAYDSSYNLPVVVIVQGYGSEVFPCSVTWTPNTVDNKKVGETLYTGTLVMPAGYVNLNNVQATIALTVQAQPLITASSELSSQRVYLNEDPAPIFVEASVTEAKTLTYQWSYRSGDSEIPMPEITGPIYDPPVSTTPGTVYYTCVISSENAEPVTVLAGIVVTSAEPAVLPDTTAPVAVDENSPITPITETGLSEMPAITEQPTSISQLSGVALATSLAQATRTAQAALGTPKADVTTASFTVDAQITDGGELSYQWFESTDAVNADGKPIDGATDKTLAVDTSGPAGTTYYYVEITNTKAGCLPVTAVSLPVSLTVV